jgi:hypothetical protein
MSPGALAAHGDDLWLADRSQPLLLHIRHGADEVFQWTAGHAGGAAVERLHADATGVWIVGPAGVSRCTAGGRVDRLDDGPVGLSALSQGVLATTGPRRWPVPAEPDVVRLRRLTGGPRDVEVPTVLTELRTVGAGFIGLGLDHGPTPMTPTSERVSRLVSVSADGELRVGKEIPGPFDECETVLFGGELPRLLVAADGGWSPRLDLVAGDLSLVPGPHVWPWLRSWETHRDRLVVLSHSPDGTGRSGWWPLPGPPAEAAALARGYLLGLVDLTASGATLRDFVVVPAGPQYVASGAGPLIWMTMWLKAADGTSRHGLMSWDPTGDDGPVEHDLRPRLKGVALDVSQPGSDPEIEAYVQQQRLLLEQHLGTGFDTFDALAVEVLGSWPKTCLVVRFMPRAEPRRVGAYAIGLFDEDGQWETDEDFADFYWVDVEIMEDLETGVFGRKASQTSGTGPVWLREPPNFEGLLPDAP